MATTEESIKISIWTPLIYVGVMLTGFVIFSVVYRRRKLTHLTQVEPIFQENYPAIMYAFLKEKYDDPDLEKSEKPHAKVMKAALLRRAAESVRRSLKLKENEPIFAKLYQEGLIGDDNFKQFEIESKLQELELKSISQEAESYKKGWSQLFFLVAQEICFNEALRRRLNSIDSRSEALSELWGNDEKNAKSTPVLIENKTATKD